MPKFIPTFVTNILGNPASAAATINSNLTRIAEEIEETLNRFGVAPNQMQDVLDMNHNRIINLPEAVDDSEPVRLGDMEEIVVGLVDDIKEGPPGPQGPPGQDGASTTMVPFSFTGNGTAGPFTLPAAPAANTHVLLFLTGVGQVPAVDYTTIGDALTFEGTSINGAAYHGYVFTALSVEAFVSVSDYRNKEEVEAATIPADITFLRIAGYKTVGDGGGALYVRVALEPTHAGKIQSANGVWWEIAEEVLRFRMFGAVPDYTTDSLSAVEDTIAAAQALDRPIHDHGVYGLVGQLTLSGSPVTICGTQAAPHIWYRTTDDGDNLRPGFKHLMPGLVFVFKNGGTPSALSLPNRTDDYATVTPCLNVDSNFNTLRSVAVVQDMDVYDAAGNYNDIAEVAATIADDFDLGIFVNDTCQNTFEDVTVFGYFDKAGTAIWSTTGDDDPDYNMWIGGSTYGRHGVALLGANDAPAAYGLSGSRFSGTLIGAKDSKARRDTDTETDHYANAADWRCLYIDGDVDASTAEINGHYFNQCVFRTSSDHHIELDHASNVLFTGCIFEYTPYSVPNSSGTPEFIATANVKKGVQFVGCRINYPSMLFNEFVPNLAGAIGVFIVGDPIQGRAGFFTKDPGGGYGGVILGADGAVGDPAVQFTKDVSNQNADWKIRMDVSSGDNLQFLYDNNQRLTISQGGIIIPNDAGIRRIIKETGTTLTIASGAITVTNSLHVVGTEGAAASDDLETINGGVEGMELTLRAATTGQTVVLKRTGGNIRLDGGTDKSLATSGTFITLIYQGGVWRQKTPLMVNS